MGNARNLADNLPITGATGSRNIIINGAMQVSQRHGTSSVTVAAGDHYVVDRFKIQDYSDATFSSQQVTDAPEGFRNSSKITVTGTDTSLGTTQYQRFIQPIEGLNVSHLNYGWSFAQTTTLSFHVKSSLTGTFSVFVFNSAANRSFISTYTISAANTWEKKTITITGDQGGTWLKDTGVGMYLGWSLGTGTNFQTSTLNAWDGSFKMAGTSQVNLAGTNGATWQVAGCQLEVGDTATPFEHRSFGDELQRCKRYFEVYAPITSTNGSIGLLRVRTSVNGYSGVLNYYEKRASPTATLDFDRLHKPGVAMDTISSTSVDVSSGETSSCTVNCTPTNDSTISTYAFLGKSSGQGELTLDAEF